MLQRNSKLSIGLAIFSCLILLGVLRFQPWRTEGAAVGGRQELTVGFLPVTCHLTCPVTDFATRTSTLVITMTARLRRFHNFLCAARIRFQVDTTSSVAQTSAGRNG